MLKLDPWEYGTAPRAISKAYVKNRNGLIKMNVIGAWNNLSNWNIYHFYSHEFKFFKTNQFDKMIRHVYHLLHSRRMCIWYSMICKFSPSSWLIPLSFSRRKTIFFWGGSLKKENFYSIKPFIRINISPVPYILPVCLYGSEELGTIAHISHLF